MRIDTLPIVTADGLTLQADLTLPDAIVGAVAICHPHPQYGGDRTNNVVDALFRRFAAAGYAALRFDFRGVNGSEGTHGGGVDERLDALAALEAVEPFSPDGPLVLAGYSFGALVALGVTHPRLDAWIVVAPPLTMSTSDPVAASDPRPKLLLVPEHDQFSPPAAVARRVATWHSAEVRTIAMADHFLAGRTGVVADEALAFVSALAAR